MAKRTCLPWPENLLTRMEPQPNGCIYFTGSLNESGYGQVWIKVAGSNLLRKAHRAAYELLVGPIPDGLVLDHECHNRDASCLGGSTCPHRRCVNPEHLAPKSKGENTRASLRWSGNKTHCHRGHPYTAENTIVESTGRRCRICRSQRYLGSATERAVAAINAVEASK